MTHVHLRKIITEILTKYDLNCRYIEVYKKNKGFILQNLDNNEIFLIYVFDLDEDLIVYQIRICKLKLNKRLQAYLGSLRVLTPNWVLSLTSDIVYALFSDDYDLQKKMLPDITFDEINCNIFFSNGVKYNNGGLLTQPDSLIKDIYEYINSGMRFNDSRDIRSGSKLIKFLNHIARVRIYTKIKEYISNNLYLYNFVNTRLPLGKMFYNNMTLVHADIDSVYLRSDGGELLYLEMVYEYDIRKTLTIFSPNLTFDAIVEDDGKYMILLYVYLFLKNI